MRTRDLSAIMCLLSVLCIMFVPLSHPLTGGWGIQNGGFEDGLAGWLSYGGGFLGATGENVHGGSLSLKISASIEEQACVSQYVDFPYTTFMFGFWVLRGELDSWTAFYLARDYDGNTVRPVSSFIIQDSQIELNAWDNMGAPGRQMFDYNVTVGDWHHVVFVANGTSRTQEVYVDGSLVTTLNSRSGDVFAPDILIFGDVSTNACNGTFYFDDLELTSQSPPTAMATISVVPSTIDLGTNRDFIVNVRVENIEDLYSWELRLYYLNNVVNCTDAVEGDFLRSNNGNTLWVISNEPSYNATHGLVRIGSSLIGQVFGVDGSGLLASVSFKAIAIGSTSLEVTDTIVLNSRLQEIVHNTIGGFVEVREPMHDITVSSAVPNKSIVGQGYSMNISVNVANNGDYVETFALVVYYNSSIVGTQEVIDLHPDQSLTLTFVWNTSDATRDYYILYALQETAGNVTGISVLQDSTTASKGVIHVCVPGNINGDSVVNMQDIGSVCSCFGSIFGRSRYLANCDLNDDGKIDMRDVGRTAKNFGMIDS